MSEHLPRILVVEDDPQVREAIRWALEEEGLDVVTASGGREALTAASDHPPDLVLLDLTLPEINGYEVANSLRSMSDRQLPILLMTADGQAPRKAEMVGAYAFLRKPFHVEMLIDLIRRGLSDSGST